MKPLRSRLAAMLITGFALCAASCDQSNLAAARSTGAIIPSRDAARMAASGVDSLLDGKTPSPATQNFFSTYDYSKHAYKRNPDCLAARIDITGLSVANSARVDGPPGMRGCVTMITPLHGVTNHHFAGPYQAGIVHDFVDRENTFYSRRVVKAEQVGDTDIEVVTLDSPLPPSIRPAQFLPAGAVARLLPAGTPLLATNQKKQAIITELAGMTGTDIVIRPALAAGRLPWTASPPAILGDSDSPSFVLLGGRPLLLFTYFTSASGPALSENLAGIKALLGRGYSLDIATVE